MVAHDHAMAANYRGLNSAWCLNDAIASASNCYRVLSESLVFAMR